MTPLQTIRRLLRFYKTHGWCREDLAKNAKGCSVQPLHPDAYAFCFEGAGVRLGMNLYALPASLSDSREAAWTINDACKTKRAAMALLRARERVLVARAKEKQP